MTKFTVVLDEKGELAAAQVGAGDRHSQEAGLRAGPGQTLHVVDLPDDIASIADAAHFERAVKPHLPHP
jgi:hypothetical protein